MSAKNGKMPSTQTTPKTTTATSAAAISIKREPSGTSATPLSNGNGMAKLTSLAPARDLTLGGRGGSTTSATAKKMFLPNLNVVRNKNANVKTSKDTTARGRGARKTERGARGSSSARGRGGNSSLIQTAGVFSEGAGALSVRKSTGSSSYGRSNDEPSVNAMRRPTILKTEVKVFDSKAEAAQIREFLGDSEDEDFEDKKTDLTQIPTKLKEGKWKTEVKLEKQEIQFMSTFEDQADESITTARHMQSLHIEPHQRQLENTHYPENVAEFFAATQPQIFIMQLPDTLPCVHEPDKEQDSKKNIVTLVDSPTTSANATSPATKPGAKTNVLKLMDEGQVGKLLRYKSGKIKFVLGESYFDLEMGMETGFLQELMSITANREERSGNMINLGPIQAKLNATPDWEYLFDQQQAMGSVERT